MARAKLMPPGKKHWIIIHEETAIKLNKLKYRNENYDSVIRRLIEFYCDKSRLKGY